MLLSLRLNGDSSRLLYFLNQLKLLTLVLLHFLRLGSNKLCNYCSIRYATPIPVFLIHDTCLLSV